MKKNSQIGIRFIRHLPACHTSMETPMNGIVGYSFKDDFVCDYPFFDEQDKFYSQLTKKSTACEVYPLTSDRLNQFWETDMDTRQSGKTNSRKYVCRNIPAFIRFLLRYSPNSVIQTLMKRCPRFAKTSIPERNSPVFWESPLKH